LKNHKSNSAAEVPFRGRTYPPRVWLPLRRISYRLSDVHWLLEQRLESPAPPVRREMDEL
jgi:hypothetical protein